MADDLSAILNNQDRRIRQLETKSIREGALIPASGAYLLQARLIYATTGVFNAASYPDLKAVKITAQGGGGGGGGSAATTVDQKAISGAGGGGGFAESLILAASLPSLTADINVKVGTGGAGGTTSGNGGDGLGSWFGGTVGSSSGALVIANGGVGGLLGPANTSAFGAASGAGGTTNTGDIAIDGGAGGIGFTMYPSSGTNVFANALTAPGGHASMGAPGRYISTSSGTSGYAGVAYGGGAGGSGNSESQSAIAGSAGADGLIIIEVYV